MPSAAVCGPSRPTGGGEVAAGMSPAEFGVGDIALIAIRRAEMLADLGQAIEFVLRHVFRHPVAAVVGEIELLGFRMPVEADGVADAARDHSTPVPSRFIRADLAVGVVVQHVVAGLSDRNIELVVGADGDELPAMGLVLRQVVVDVVGFGGLSRLSSTLSILETFESSAM